ncbi:MAG: acetyl-CoA carboxylase, carboxyltransferase subunit beta [Holosporales bacterium]|jgi:acetyl-CoA carboxylase carboxyl transferase subunit beta|nr:acetyl-CoA carboxylase, carboxyltransferase subunit beta [Holosporales bacterium]
MNWLTEFVRPKIQALMEKSSETPEDLWTKCQKCEQMIFHLELHENLHVCPNCGHHMRMSTTERFNLLFDGQQYQMIPLPLTKDDPIQFKDSRRYVDRLKEHRLKTKQHDAISVAMGDVEGKQALVAVMNFEFMGGSMGTFVGRAFYATAELAVSKRIPFVVVTASGGARMQEGMLSLMQMPATIIAVEMLRDARIPYVVLLTNPTMGGVSASFAMLGDVILAEPGALIGFAGPRVIEETINQKLPEGFQRAEFLQDHGMVDIVVERKALKGTLGRILGALAG